MDSYTEIRNKIRAMTGQKTPLLLTGKVESVSGETCTVSIGDLTLTDVRLRSVVNGESSKLLITPKQGSYHLSPSILVHLKPCLLRLHCKKRQAHLPEKREMLPLLCG